MSEGFRETELAAKLGRTPSWVSERVGELRQEILHQAGLFPPLTEAEDNALRDDIRRRGVVQPILVDEQLRIIDGRNRLRIADELGVPCPYLVATGLTDDEKHEIGIALNATRRQLTRQQRRKLVECELMRDPSRSDRRIAAICGVTHPTVNTVRNEIAAGNEQWRHDQLPQREIVDVHGGVEKDDTPQPVWKPPPSPAPPPVQPVTRVDTLGRRQPATKPPRPRVKKPVAELTCPCCDTPLQLWRRDGQYQLEHTAQPCAA